TAVQVEGEQVKGTTKDGEWAADVPAPTDVRGTFEVSVQVTNGVGLTTDKTIRIELVDPGKEADPKGGAKYGSIAGTIKRGDTPQPGVAVALRDQKGEVKDVTKTDGAGKYAFKDVLPGPYLVASARPALQLVGQAAVVVVAGQKAVADVQLNVKNVKK